MTSVSQRASLIVRQAERAATPNEIDAVGKAVREIVMDVPEEDVAMLEKAMSIAKEKMSAFMDGTVLPFRKPRP